VTDVLLRANRTPRPSDDADDTRHDQREPHPLRNCKRLVHNDNGQDRDLQRNEAGIERSRMCGRHELQTTLGDQHHRRPSAHHNRRHTTPTKPVDGQALPQQIRQQNHTPDH